MKFSIFVTAIAAASGAVEATWCRKPGTYRCTLNKRGWETCNTGHQWQYSGSCGRGNYCTYYAPSKSPYCIPKGTTFP